MTGRTRQGRVVNFPGGEDLVGRLIDVRLTRGYTWGLMGERAEIAAALR